jgi:hypothetical protein
VHFASSRLFAFAHFIAHYLLLLLVVVVVVVVTIVVVVVVVSFGCWAPLQLHHEV